MNFGEFLTCSTILCGCCVHIKNSVYVAPLPTTMDELGNRKRAETVAEAATQDMLAAVWNEFDYHIDICHVVRAH